MFQVKCYKYDSTQESNGYRGTGENDFSKYVLQGTQLKGDITQVLDTGELTLAGLPFSKEFDPETKFIVDIVETNEFGEENIVNTQHLCVSRDTAEQPILSDENYFNHHISFIEPSVVAQKRLVDNIATTYKLKDVTLKEVPAFLPLEMSVNIEGSYFYPSANFGTYHSKEGTLTQTEKYGAVCGKYFSMEGNLLALNRNNQTFNNIYNDIESFATSDGYKARFQIPKIRINYGVNGTRNFAFRGYASIDYKISEFNLNDEVNPTQEWSGEFISNSNLGSNLNEDQTQSGVRDIIDGEWLLEDLSVYIEPINLNAFTNRYFKKYTETSAGTPSYITQEITIQPDKKYLVEISLHQFPDNISTGGRDYKYTGSQPAYYLTNEKVYTFYVIGTTLTQNIYPNVARLTARQTSGSGYLITYDVETGDLVYASSTPYSAMALLQKAIINSSIYEKQDGVYIADVNNSNLPFYVDSDFVDELRATVIIENFYNQKNLWEIMVEVGNYIHAIPELRFGTDDRFIITFNRLGRTDEHIDTSTKISIFNSRSVEDYISAASSYITNMVQLGGLIEEWVFPKTTDDTLLISNDTAELLTSKPIIELLYVGVRRNSDPPNTPLTDMTKFIYEENVYKTLGLDYQLDPNRGIGMFYKLGTNVITGGQYQLPQANTNIYSDYAFKKIIYCAYNGYPSLAPAPTNGYWTDLKVSDYSFYIRYRTKDSVRQNHIRPDLRKYLFNSKYDKYPEHNQFNNQTDVVVDSIKFGNNMYGKLIKTGNSTYEKMEWATSFDQLKHKGELYRLNGELYYVANVEWFIFSSYIISKVSFSKDYNELSNIIGIPSEPRFYEISEQSLIWRELAINDTLLLTDDQSQITYKENYLFNCDHIADLILSAGTDFAKYAITVYKGDKDISKYDQTVGQANLYKEVLNPVNAYSSENTLTYEWDMEDNYSAGNKVINVDPNNNVKINERVYNSLWAVPYTDIYGKAALLDFFLLGDIGTLSTETIKALPETPITTRTDVVKPFVGNYNILATNVKDFNTDYNGRGLGLLKDCREAMSINYNLQLITNSDTFVISPYIFLPLKEDVKVVLLADEVNKLSTGYIDNSKIVTPIDVNGNTMSQFFDFNVTKTQTPNSWDTSKNVVSQFSIDLTTLLANVNDGHFNGADGFQQVKAIAVLCDVSLNTGTGTGVGTLPYKTQFVLARNIPENWGKSKAISNWHFGAPNNTLFKNRQ